MNRRLTLATIFTTTALLFAMPITAQEQQSGPLFFKADGGGVHQSEVDLTDSNGGFAVDRWFVSAGIDYVWDQRNSLGFAVGGGRSSYEFDDLVDLGGSEPWNKVEDTRMSVTWRFGFGDTGSFILIPTVRIDRESGASTSDSATYGLYAATTWRINEDLTIGPGIGVFSRLEDGSRIFPILAIDWDITERWNLSTGRGLAASQGPGLTLNYQLNEDWSLGLAGRYENTEFRLDDKGPAAGGIGRDESLPLVLMATLKPGPRFELSVFAGIELGGTLTLKDSFGKKLDESDYDPAALFGASFNLRF
jgi:hypothetical protein